jgi:hypothetical protein
MPVFFAPDESVVLSYAAIAGELARDKALQNSAVTKP